MTLKELKELKMELTRHDYRYYVLSTPAIGDCLYDKLYRQYQDAIEELIGEDTHSLETQSLYPQWVLDEFEGVEPTT